MSRAIPVPTKAKKKAPPPPRPQLAMPLITVDEPEQERPQKLSPPIESQQASPTIPESATSPPSFETPIEQQKEQPATTEPQIVEAVVEISPVPLGIKKPPIKKPGPPPPKTRKPVPPPGFKSAFIQEIAQEPQIKPQTEQKTDQNDTQIKTQVAQSPLPKIQTEQTYLKKAQTITEDVGIEPVNAEPELGQQIAQNTTQPAQKDSAIEIKFQAPLLKPPPAPPKAAVRKPKGPPPPSKIKPAPSSPKHIPSTATPNIQQEQKEPEASVQQPPLANIQKPIQNIPQKIVEKIEAEPASKVTLEEPIKEVIKPKVPPPMPKIERSVPSPAPVHIPAPKQPNPTPSKIERQPVIPQSTPSKSNISAKLQELRKAKQQMLLDESFLEEDVQQNEGSDFVKEEDDQPQPQKPIEQVITPKILEAPVEVIQEKQPIEVSKPVFDVQVPSKINPIAPPKQPTRAPPAPGKRIAPPPPTIKNPPKLPESKVEAVEARQVPPEPLVHPVQPPRALEVQIQQSPLQLPSPAEPPKVIAESQVAPSPPIQKENKEKNQQVIIVKSPAKEEGQDQLQRLLQRYHSLKTGYINNLRQLDELIHFQKQQQDNQIQKINHLLADLHRKNDSIKQICSIQELPSPSEQEEIAI